MNVYGVTETAVYNTHKVLTEDDILGHGATTPIGSAYQTSPALVVGDDLTPLPAGQSGEILIGGRQVARGYYGDPERTAQRFVSLPDRPGRWYRTGDLGSADDRGLLHHAGRMDDQVKVRGFRIELGEIDHAVLKLAWIRESATVVQSSRLGEPMLTEFVVTTSDQRGTQRDVTAEVQAHLRLLLPEYMVPTRVVCLDRIPLNSNGKIDRRALSSHK